MFEARLMQGNILKKIVEAIRELVPDANMNVNETGISMQAMDSSHVSLCSLLLRSDCFDHYRCDRNLSLGLKMANVSKLLKCAGNDEIITLRAQDEGDVLTMLFENESEDRISDFELKLMDIDTENLGIPDTDYKCNIKMPSAEFQRIVRDLSSIGETCIITVTKGNIKFSVEGDLGTGNITVRENSSVEKDEDKVIIEMEEPVTLSFAVRYLNFFCKATPLGKTVSLSMSPEVPVVVEYPIDTTGYIRYYLAPKIDDEEEDN